uniref:polymorphic toxin-type HINT domain-containing protein n=1 Tax=Paractinoplanes polyasparticus TaxID=2856853 RepID=UPI001C8565D9|nr:polymorphic toxin-type HINT domain-containing protein [Actinoplanes polyasparticus]
MKHPSSRLTKALALAVTATLTVTMSQQPAWAEKADPYTPPKPAEKPAVPVTTVAALPPASDTSRQASARPAPVWPAAGRQHVALGATGTTFMLKAATGTATRAAAAPATMQVDVLDQEASARAGVRGLLFTASRADGATTTAPAAVTVDYRPFATAFGGDWANRLQLVKLPDCALSTPQKPQCAGTPLPTRNNAKTKQVSAEVSLTGSSQLLALSGAPSGSTGNFGATTLKSSGTWSAGGASGNFSWSFPMRVPPAMGGPEPTVELAYSSQSVDGRMAASNNQPSEIGEGFEMGVGGFIERRFKPCSDDTDGGNNSGTTVKNADDQCWVTNNATMSLNGSGGELIKEAGESNRWHLRNDDGSKIERRTGADNGAAEGEWWVVTSTNGTQYWFGRNKLPGWTSGATTDSAWTVPVFGNHKGEPCNETTFAASMCKRAWRWNLDYVVDPHGNTMSYWYETATNNYKSIATDKIQPYTRSGQVDHIVYGTRVEPNLTTGKDTVFTGHGAARVDFTYVDRCLSDCTTHDDPQWPDTPWDLSCSATSCDVWMPSFWTTRRLTTITTSTYAALTGKFRDVEKWTLSHSFPDPEDTTRAGLWLDKVQHDGLVGATPTSLPDVTFAGRNYPNRVDAVDNAPAMNWRRLTDINTETGAVIHVDYLESDCKAGTAVPTDAKNNTMRCYPVRWAPPGFPKQTDYFNKYVVNDVTETDRTGGAPRVLRHYDYLGTPAWHYADDDGLIPDDAKTWNVWRGYQKVGVTVGDPGEQTYTESTYFRGMHGDYLSKDSTRPASVPDSQGGSTPDLDVYAGMVRESRVLLGRGGAEVSGMLQDPWQSEPTATRKIGDVTTHARFVQTQGTRSRVTLDHAPWTRTTYTKSTFDDYGMTVREDDYGDEAVTGDEQCTKTTFEPRNTTAWLLNLPHRLETFAVDCATATGGGLTDTQVIGDARSYYDKHGYGVAPSLGDLTKTEQMSAYNGGSPTYTKLTETSYDELGRSLESSDTLGRISKTSYTPSTTGPVVQTIDTNPLGWTTTAIVEPAWGLATATIDVNLLRTELEYDGLGRLTKVWNPGRTPSPNADPDIGYDYLIRTNGVNAVTTKHLNPEGGVTKSYTLYDGLLRTRQTQTMSPSGGRILSDTFYDTAGRESLSYGAYWDKTGTPGTDLAKPLTQQDVPNQTATVYDRAGRPTASIFQPKSVEKWRTTTAYGGDHTDVTPPQGATGTSSWVDARGRTIQLRQYPTRTPTGTDYAQTDYAYNSKGLLASVTGPDKHKWTYTYDLRGRKTSSLDPDGGESLTTYDDLGRVTGTRNANQQWLTYKYDDLDRKIALWKGSSPVAGGQLAQWDYDSALFYGTTTKVKGQPFQATRIDSGKEYITATRVYDQQYRPTTSKVTIADSEPGIGGTYEYDTGYNPDGSISAVTYPASGDLLQETVRYTYTNQDQPLTLTNNYGTQAQSSIVSNAQYDALAHTTQYKLYTGLYSGVGKPAYVSLETDQTTGRLNQISVHRDGLAPNTVTDQHYTYDDAGNVTKIADTPTGGNYTDIQCFTYDRYQRLQEAWTPAQNDCEPSPTNAGLGGVAPYWHTYTYTPGGARSKLVDHNTAKGDVTTNYRYADTTANEPTTGQPHILRSATTIDNTGTKTATYSYDGAGNTKTRPGPNGTQTLQWDAEGHLQSVTDAAGSTTYLYDADGNRLISRDTTGRTLYLGNQELRYTNSTAKTSCTRYYEFGDSTVAQRTAQGVTWLFNDHQGTQNVMVDEKTLAETIRRQTPFGAPRGTAAAWGNTKGFVGGTADLTGLTHLGAREYDPALGRFISIDPLFNASDPQSFEGYAYAVNSPIVHSDPSGLIAREPGGGGTRPEGGHTESPKPQEDPPPPSEPTKKKKKCNWLCKSGNWLDDNKAAVIGGVVGAAVGIGCGAAIGITGVGAVACGAAAGAVASMVQYAIETKVEHKGNFSWGGLAKNGALGAVIGGFTGGVTSIAGQGVKAGIRSLASGAGAKAAANAGTAAVKKEASSIASGLTRGGFSKSAAKSAAGAADEGAARAPSASCPTHSFAAATLVLMADGTAKPIAAVKIGDKVVATDPISGKRYVRTVTKVHVHQDTALTDLTIENNGARNVIQTTRHHPIWNSSKQKWTDAGDLNPGDKLNSIRTTRTVAAVKTYTGVSTMYDLTVDATHTYYVLAGETPILVHNCGTTLLGTSRDIRTHVKANPTQDFNVLNVRGAMRSGYTLKGEIAWGKGTGRWNWTRNKRFIDDAIDRGDEIKFVSDPFSKRFSGGNVFGRELNYLSGKGFSIEETVDGFWRATKKP